MYNNVIIVCKKYYTDSLVKELGINNANSKNPTYSPIDDSFETIAKSHIQFITSVGLEMSEEDQDLPYLYWTPKLHKSPYKHWFIAGCSKCTTKNLSCLLIKLLSTIKIDWWGIATLKPAAMVLTKCGFWRTQEVCCHHLINLTSVQLHWSRHLIFQHFTPQSHIIYWNLELVILYTGFSERKMGV